MRYFDQVFDIQFAEFNSESQTVGQQMSCYGLGVLFQDRVCQRLRRAAAVLHGHCDVTDRSTMETDQRLQLVIASQISDRVDGSTDLNVDYFYGF